MRAETHNKFAHEVFTHSKTTHIYRYGTNYQQQAATKAVATEKPSSRRAHQQARQSYDFDGKFCRSSLASYDDDTTTMAP